MVDRHFKFFHRTQNFEINPTVTARADTIWRLGAFHIWYDFPAVQEAAEFAYVFQQCQRLQSWFPQIIVPSSSVHSFISIAIPIAVLILTNDIAV